MRGLDEILEGDEPLAAVSEFIEQFAHLNMQYRIVSTIFLREETHLGKEAQRKLRNFEHSFDAKLTKLISSVESIPATSRSATRSWRRWRSAA